MLMVQFRPERMAEISRMLTTAEQDIRKLLPALLDAGLAAQLPEGFAMSIGNITALIVVARAALTPALDMQS